MVHLIHSGELIKASEFHLTHSNRAFLYGDGIFESMRAFDTVVPLLNDHISRLNLSMQLLGLEPPTYFTTTYFEKQITQLLEAENLEDARLRLTVYRKEGGRYTPETDEAEFILQAEPKPGKHFTLNAQGLHVGTYPDHFKPYNRLAGLKSCNALLYVLAGRYARDKGWDEAFVLNEQGRVAESVSSNVLVWTGEELLTPAYTEACVSGVMREVVLTAANWLNINARPAEITFDVLEEAEEVWLTNAVQGMRWVGEWNGIEYRDEQASRVLTEVNKRLNLS